MKKMSVALGILLCLFAMFTALGAGKPSLSYDTDGKGSNIISPDFYLPGPSLQGGQVGDADSLVHAAPGRLIATPWGKEHDIVLETISCGVATLYDFRDSGYRLIDSTGHVVDLPLSNITLFNDNIGVSETNGKYYCFDRTGKKLFDLPYDEVHPFFDGMAAVRSGDKWGFIDRTGKLVIAPAYDEPGSFSEGLAAVLKNGKYGYISKTGEVVLPFGFSEPYQFHQGLVIVEKEGKKGYMDPTGKMVIEARFDDAFVFDEQGYAVVGIKTGETTTSRWGTTVPAMKYGVIDRSGKLVADFMFDDMLPFHEGLALIYEGEDISFVNHQGERVHGPYADATPYNSGVAFVRPKGQELGAYVDRQGNPVFGFRYVPNKDSGPHREFILQEGSEMVDGFAMVKIDGRWYVLRADQQISGLAD